MSLLLAGAAGFWSRRAAKLPRHSQQSQQDVASACTSPCGARSAAGWREATQQLLGQGGHFACSCQHDHGVLRLLELVVKSSGKQAAGAGFAGLSRLLANSAPPTAADPAICVQVLEHRRGEGRSVLC